MSAHSEEILDDAVNGREALQMDRRLEAPHLAFTLTRRLVRDFRAVVRILVRTVDHRRHHHAARCRVTAKLVRDQPARDTTLPFQQLPEEPDGRVPIPSRLDQNVEEVTVLVHRSPQLLLATVEGDEHLIEIPRVSEVPAPLPEPSRIHAPERATPPSNRLIGDSDAPLGQEVLNISKTEVEAKVEPDRVSDDVWREAIAVVAGCGADHPATLLLSTST